MPPNPPAGAPNLEAEPSPLAPPGNNPIPGPRPAVPDAAVAPAEPKSVLSVILSRIALSTRDSHTPSHFHAAGFFGEEGDADDDEPVAGPVVSVWDASAPVVVEPGVAVVMLRWARQACQAPGLPAEASGRASRTDGSVKEA